MDRRPVSQVRRGARGAVTAVCDPGQPWSPRPAPDVVADIVERGIQYYVPWVDGDAGLVVVRGRLWCDRDRGPRNNLLDLPECSGAF